MDAGCVAVHFREIRQHRRHDLGRGPGGGVVVEVNHVHLLLILSGLLSIFSKLLTRFASTCIVFYTSLANRMKAPLPASPPAMLVLNECVAPQLAEVAMRFRIELESSIPCVNTLVRHIGRYHGKML